MHLLLTQPGEVSDGTEAVDLGQSPGDIIVLSAAASDLAVLSAANQRTPENAPSLRLANLMQLGHNMSVDLYLERTIAPAKLVVVRLLGGVGYWSYGIEQLLSLCRRNDIILAVVPGDDQPDLELLHYSTLPADTCHRLWQYFAQGGSQNGENFLKYAHDLVGFKSDWLEPAPLVRAGLYWPGFDQPDLNDLRQKWQGDGPAIAIVFYRSLLQADDLAPIDALVAALADRGANALPIFINSLKDRGSREVLSQIFSQISPTVILNCTGFAVSAPGEGFGEQPFSPADCPVFQVILSGGTKDAWVNSQRGLGARDLAMNVALPEVDGRLITRAISFKSGAQFDGATQSAVVKHVPEESRVKFVADLAGAWARLRVVENCDKRVVIIMANYPNKDGRIGNGVGLDTPEAITVTLNHLAQQGYELGCNVPRDSAALMELILEAPTNALTDVRAKRDGGMRFSLDDYLAFFNEFPESVRVKITDQWGEPAKDPFFDQGDFVLPVHMFGNVVVAVQPARGYNVDPVATYHDPDLVPPHGYLAFYGWVRTMFDAHAVVHFGKHGNLEWLPGKALALSEACLPEVALGPLPNIYPFIVNDPGEGTQAKRRSQAVIIDHLTPPLTRAESYGPLRDLEQLVDEYYQAAGMDPRRLEYLSEQILSLSAASGLDVDVGIVRDDDQAQALGKLDNYLCELKELQIRDGLHVFGKSPDGSQARDLLVALTRLSRGTGGDKDASLIQSLSDDLGLAEFDPLDCVLGEAWSGPKPAALADVDQADWRTNGDTVERLELLAQSCIEGTTKADKSWRKTTAVLVFIKTDLEPIIESCGDRELAGLLQALDGLFVMPGPSGAPTRGRLDVLPTGRNFYSVDCRAVPSPAAWALGQKSAELLVERHFQDHGEFPRRVAISAWGTANMRTGGDDIAQALALMGVKPKWDKQSNRVTGFEVMALSDLGRPRVDVVFRVSGFFRDAFPFQMDLLDSAARAVADLKEPADANPLAAQVRQDAKLFEKSGETAGNARRRAGFRVFGSKPGAYGAGLQALIDEGCWETDEDLANAYLAWGGYAYGAGSEGVSEHALFAARLKQVELVIHNQDNREHDVLDSDDCYQFEGGIAAAIRHLSGKQPEIYHNDHSRPERPQIRTLREEIGRIVRARAANPKWIAGVMRHGYKGAFEIAATVDYLFAFAVTAQVVEDHHFELLYDAYVRDEDVRDFLEENNKPALLEIAERFTEAIDRGLWHPRSNTVFDDLAKLIKGDTQ